MKKLKILIAVLVAGNIIMATLLIILNIRLGGTKYIIWKATIGARATGATMGREDHFRYLKDSEGEIIFLGDSITSGTEWAELFENCKIKNRGISANTIENIQLRIDEVVSSKPDKIFLMIGINDLISLSAKTVAKNLKELVSTIRKLSPGTKLYVQSILPVNNSVARTGRKNKDVVYVNSEISAFCKDKTNVEYIDLYDVLADEEGNLKAEYTYDGAHLNGAAYLKWKEVIAPLL
jgi:lysophospholipase L1-like esterase